GGGVLAHSPDRHHRGPHARAAGSGGQPGDRPAAPLRQRRAVVRRSGRPGRDAERGARVAPPRRACSRRSGEWSGPPEPSVSRAPRAAAGPGPGRRGRACPGADQRPPASEPGPAGVAVRLGATPTSRVLNRWLAAAAAPTFLIDPDHSWRDQDHVATNVMACDPQPLLEALPPLDRSAWRDQWVSAGKRATAAIAAT